MDGLAILGGMIALSSIIVAIFPKPIVAWSLIGAMFVLIVWAVWPGIISGLEAGRPDAILAPVVFVIPQIAVVLLTLRMRRPEVRPGNPPKPLSGWMRIWIVATLISWIVGVFWLVSTAGNPPPPAHGAVSEVCRYIVFDTQDSSAPAYPSVQDCVQGAYAAREYVRSATLDYWGALGAKLVLVVVIPLFGGALFKLLAAVLRWIRRGFETSRVSLR